jgi:predicted anti-sigma-YlaC factor YlaD
MESKHIIDILEDGPLTAISAENLAAIRLHVAMCGSCRDAYEAAQLANVMMHQRSSQVIEPTPFFQTRVLAALKERQANESVPPFLRLWRSAGALVSSMALTTAALAVFSFLSTGSNYNVAQETAVLSNYSAEGVILDQEQNDDQISYDQVLNTIYDDDAR